MAKKARTKKTTKAKPSTAGESRGKRRAILLKMDDEIRNELEVLSLAKHKTLQELALEAVCDLLKKYDRPVSLLDAFKQSAGQKKGRRKAAPHK